MIRPEELGGTINVALVWSSHSLQTLSCCANEEGSSCDSGAINRAMKAARQGLVASHQPTRSVAWLQYEYCAARITHRLAQTLVLSREGSIQNH